MMTTLWWHRGAYRSHPSILTKETLVSLEKRVSLLKNVAVTKETLVLLQNNVLFRTKQERDLAAIAGEFFAE